MPTNVFFDTGTTAERALYEDLIIEQLKIFGQDVYYMPRALVAEDTLLGEDTLSKFDDAYMIEMYFENTEGFAGDKEIMSQFGLQNQEEATFIVSQRRFEDMISLDANLQVKTRPNEGDLIYLPIVGKIFEISFVDHDEPFYQLGNLPVYRLSTRTFQYSSEDLDTGITAIDAIEDSLSVASSEYQFTLEQSSAVNEEIRIVHGTLVGETGLLIMNGTDASSTNAGDNIIGQDDSTSVGESILLETGSEFLVSEDYIVGDMDTDKTSQNELFDTLDDTILDFSETNPFGDAGSAD